MWWGCTKCHGVRDLVLRLFCYARGKSKSGKIGWCSGKPCQLGRQGQLG
jgi:hypothetical protein